MIIYSLLRATKEATTRNVLVMMSVGVTGVWPGPPFTPDLALRHLYIPSHLKSPVNNHLAIAIAILESKPNPLPLA